MSTTVSGQCPQQPVDVVNLANLARIDFAVAAQQRAPYPTAAVRANLKLLHSDRGRLGPDQIGASARTHLDQA